MNNRQPYPIAKEGFVYVVVLAAVTALVTIVNPKVALIPLLLMLFVAFFFRNPKRVIPNDVGLLVSPADGVVMSVTELEEPEFIGGRAKKVTIFLSVFNVHLNRCPMDGKVAFRRYEPGKMLPAYKPEASIENEKNYVGIDNGNLKVLVIQITGLIARRIVSWVDIGDKVERGEQFGLIKFGSCTEMIVPEQVEILVSKGQKVVGGETVLGRYQHE